MRSKPAAVQGIFAAKGRPANNPLIVHVASLAAARALTTTWPASAEQLAARFWPGPLTLILPKSDSIPDLVTGGGPTVALRMPRNPVAVALLQAVALPIAAPSANRSTELSSTKAEHVAKSLGGRIDLILDGGTTQVGLESTVVDLSRSVPVLLRPGSITPQELRLVLPDLELASHLQQGQETIQKPTGLVPEDSTTPLASPGLMSKHYSPRATLECWSSESGRRVQELLHEGATVGWLCREVPSLDLQGDRVVHFEMPADAAAYASCLYTKLHDLDQAEVMHIVLDLPPNEEQWLAIRDRLRRAASVWNEES
jgi:L-threonylcarbamoyladenylate synthase